MRSLSHLPSSVAIAAVLLLGGTNAGFAQARPEIESGPIPGWSFIPAILVSTVYDNNVALLSELPARPDTVGDQLFVVEPSGQIAFHSPRTSFETGYRGNLRRYSDLEALDGFDQEAFATVRRRMTRRTNLFMRETFRIVPSTDELELEGVRFTRTGTHNNTFSASLDSRLTRFWQLNVSYDFSWVDFKRSDVLLRGGMIHGLRTELARNLNDRASLGVEYGLRVADLNGSQRAFTFQDVGGTFHYQIASRTQFNAAAGASQLHDRVVNETRIGPYVRADITHHMQRAIVGAGYTRSWIPTFGFGGASESQGANAYISMPVSHNRVYTHQSVSWRRTNPLIVTTFPLDTWWVRSTVGYSMSRWMRVQGFYMYSRQDTDLPGGLVNRHRVGAQVVISEPMRIQ